MGWRPMAYPSPPPEDPRCARQRDHEPGDECAWLPGRSREAHLNVTLGEREARLRGSSTTRTWTGTATPATFPACPKGLPWRRGGRQCRLKAACASARIDGLPEKMGLEDRGDVVQKIPARRGRGLRWLAELIGGPWNLVPL